MGDEKIIALITDFGAADGYVGAMKGVLISIAPDVRIIDITHDNVPQDVRHAAYVLWSTYRFFPAGTVFIAIVDPGVGSSRRIILIEDADGKKFIYPENGIMDLVLPELKEPAAFSIINEKYVIKPVSYTFHGRDIIAPAAAHLINGVPGAEFGPRIDLEIPPSPFKPVDAGKDETEGRIIYTDRFGNLITNLRLLPDQINEIKNMSVELGDRIIHGINRTYAECEYGEMLALTGSSGLLEISVRNGSAQQMLGLRVGDRVIVFNNKKRGGSSDE